VKVGDLVQTTGCHDPEAEYGTHGVVTEVTHYTPRVMLVRVHLMTEPAGYKLFVKRDLKVVSCAK
jgi:hypothetical protein